MRIHKAKKILITGHSGRGKSTLAKKLSKHLEIPMYSIDDFFWEKKYSTMWPIEKSRADLLNIYNQPAWIVEGNTRLLIKDGLPIADVVIHLEFNWLLHQYGRLIKRYLKEGSGTLWELLVLLKHITFKRYKLFYAKDEPSIKEMIAPFEEKVLHLHSREEVNSWMKNRFPT